MATRVDVAKRAGVSPSTVSRVLNESGYVAPDVRKRVLQAVSELNYVPNRIARSLKMKRCGQFACVISSLSNPFYHEMLMGIEEEALRRGYTFSLYNMTREKEGYMRLILEGFYDGLIILTPYEVMNVVNLTELSAQIPICIYRDRSMDFGIPNVHVDLYNAMTENINYLVGLGHTKIAFLGEYDNKEENPRYAGYIDAMCRHGISVESGLIQLIPYLKDTMSAGYERVIRMLELGVNFTAVAASNDLLALGAIRALMEFGIKVPSEVSVLGIDDVELSRISTPALSTARIPKTLIGIELVRMLVDQIENLTTAHISKPFSTELVVRESTAPRKC
ncbi:transcriptional regulator [Alicyclobacillus hesperidum subsp. aegles]|uniref:LacI family DNA-binding transcriptional regulator n=1 Tax=Alicyclobacillus hesperidum TaxID=89784 RepID=UPI0007191908|nr:LacI family DNA-binding transcriptional regulator [Alicyclobacillus hesperidum]KRW92487.1 LacI family transcriptional regulator [Alicyclobacillus tengchongensis]GLG00119.1 transcriptional regulator [Alicyclobacillus hesperidum subsp. aegles]